MNYLLPFVLSMAVSMSLLPALARVAARLSIVDHPGPRKIHARVIPRVGGIAMAVGVFATVSSLMPSLTRSEIGFLAGAVILVAFGIADDRFDLRAGTKLLGQLLAVCVPVFVGGIHVDSLTLTDRVHLPPLIGLGLTVVYLVGVTNAVNLTDGLDGLAGGTAFLSLCAIAWLAQVAGHGGALTLSLAFAGAVIGFLRFNTYPATVFMGDAGSQLLGYAIGVLSLLATQGADTSVSAALPVLLLGAPILDTLQVMVRRLADGRSPFRADRGHLHHRLLALGFDHHEAVMVLYSFQALLFVLAHGLRFESDLVILAVYALFAVAVMGGLTTAERVGWRVRAVEVDAHTRPGALRRVAGVFSDSAAVQRVATLVIAALLTGYAVAVVRAAPAVPGDLRLFIGILLVAAVVALATRRGREVGMLEKAVWYLTIACLVYSDTSIDPSQRPAAVVDAAFILVLAAVTLAALRSNRAGSFAISPLDVIILFVAVVVPNLPGLVALPAAATLAVAKVVILLYALEVLMTGHTVRPVWFRACGALLLTLMAVAFPVSLS